MDKVPSTLGGLLTWIASGVGIGVLLLWLAKLPFWAPLDNDTPLVKRFKALKVVLLALIGIALGVAATAGTTYIPSGIIDSLEPYYKIVWTVVTILLSMYTGQAVTVRYEHWRAWLDLQILKQAGVPLTGEVIRLFFRDRPKEFQYAVAHVIVGQPRAGVPGPGADGPRGT